MIKKFFREETGSQSLEVAIITITLIALALVFKEQILSLAKTIADKIIG